MFVHEDLPDLDYEYLPFARAKWMEFDEWLEKFSEAYPCDVDPPC